MNEIILSNNEGQFQSSLWQLVESRTFNDVNFLCKDGRTQGNRLILSMYSPVLKDVFKENPLIQHPWMQPDNGIVALQSSVYDVNNLLNILHSRSPLKITRHSLEGVKEIAKVFKIQLLTKNTDDNNVLVKAVIQKSGDDGKDEQGEKKGA